MPRDYSSGFQRTVNSTSAPETPVTLLQINHPDLTTPVRVNNGSEDITHLGNVYVALAFQVTMPSDPEQGLPRAQLAIDNVGKTLTSWIESSGGGRGATIDMTQVMPSNPDVAEFTITMDLSNVRVNSMQVTGELGFSDLLNLPSVPLVYTPVTAPGLF